MYSISSQSQGNSKRGYRDESNSLLISLISCPLELSATVELEELGEQPISESSAATSLPPSQMSSTNFSRCHLNVYYNRNPLLAE